MPRKADVIVVGGGVAGIACALEASDRGARVLLLEALPHLGGRVAGGRNFDTGRHLASSAHQHFLALCQRIGSYEHFGLERLELHALLGERSVRWKPSTGRWQQPLDAALGLLGSRFLPIHERLPSLFCLGRALRDAPDWVEDEELLATSSPPLTAITGATLATYAARNRWPKSLKERLMIPVAMGMFNARPEEVAAAPFLTALKRLFSTSQLLAGWTTSLDHGNAITNPAYEALSAAKGVEVRTGAWVNSLSREAGEWVVDSGDKRYRSARLVLTPPPWQLGFLKGCPEAGGLYRAASRADGCGILTLRARFTRAQCVSGPIAEGGPEYGIWFSRRSDEGDAVIERVVSGLPRSYKPVPPTLKQQFEERAAALFGAEDLKSSEFRYYPRSTPTLRVGSQRPLLHQGEGLLYAGDWTATGLPATLESAARAGVLAGRAATT